MLNKLKYVIVERDVSAGTASKVAKLVKPTLREECVLTGCMFDIKGKEDFDGIVRIYRDRNGHIFNNIKGVQIPLHNLPLYSSAIRGLMPKGAMVLSDVETEFFFYDGLKKEKADFYRKNNLLPDKMKEFMQNVHSEQEHWNKVQEHKVAWREIVNDKNTLVKFITNFVNIQSKHGAEIICCPTPLILDTEHLDFVVSCYEKAKELYHGDALELEDSGKLVALYINIHVGFLSKLANVMDLIATIRKLSPKALVIKIARLLDVRNEPTETIKNWAFLMANIGVLTSDEIPIPTIYLSAGVDGLIAQAFYGIDIFTQSFYKLDNIEKEFITSSPAAKTMWRNNPKLSSGKIAIYDTKEFISRIDFEKLLKANGNSPYPMKELSDFDPKTVEAASPHTFRDFSKWVLFILRDFEIQETINAIKAGDVRLLKSKFKRWASKHPLLP